MSDADYKIPRVVRDPDFTMLKCGKTCALESVKYGNNITKFSYNCNNLYTYSKTSLYATLATMLSGAPMGKSFLYKRKEMFMQEVAQFLNNLCIPEFHLLIY